MENNLPVGSSDHLHQCGGALNGCKKCWSTHHVLKVAIALAVLAIVFATGYVSGKMTGRYHNRRFGFGGQNMMYANRVPGRGGMMLQGTTQAAPGTGMMRFSVPTTQSDTPNDGTSPAPQQ